MGLFLCLHFVIQSERRISMAFTLCWQSSNIFPFPLFSLNIKGITMNDFEWYVKWKWVAILLVILLVMALLMHP